MPNADLPPTPGEPARASAGGDSPPPRPEGPRPERPGLISVVIPNWNGARYLPGCLDSLRAQTYPSFEVIVVDNASTDGSDRLVEERYPEYRLLRTGSNLGFAGGVNAGIREARGEIIALLNNDAEAEPDWLSAMAAAAAAHPEAGFFACKILLFDRRDHIHSAGDFYGRNGVPGNRGVWQRDDGRFDAEEYVLSACGGASGWRRSLLEDVGLFDESFFMYCEDVDLSLRAQLRGYSCLYIPASRVYHRLSATGGGETASYYCGRNFLAVAIKNLPYSIIRANWRSLVGAQLGFTLDSLRHFREKAARARLRGQIAALGEIPARLAQRRQIQSRRRVPDRYIESMLS